MVGLSVVLEVQKGCISKKTPQVINKTTILSTTTTHKKPPLSPSPSPFQTPTFLDQCFLCGKRLSPGKDIYMYKWVLLIKINNMFVFFCFSCSMVWSIIHTTYIIWSVRYKTFAFVVVLLFSDLMVSGSFVCLSMLLKLFFFFWGVVETKHEHCRGDRAFCSVECRCKQIFSDEEEAIKKEKCCLAAMRPTSSSYSSSSTSRHHRKETRNRGVGFF